MGLMMPEYTPVLLKRQVYLNDTQGTFTSLSCAKIRIYPFDMHARTLHYNGKRP